MRVVTLGHGVPCTAVRPRSVLVIDNAYVPLVDHQLDSMPLLRSGNVAILHSMTKDHALAGDPAGLPGGPVYRGGTPTICGKAIRRTTGRKLTDEKRRSRITVSLGRGEREAICNSEHCSGRHRILGVRSWGRVFGKLSRHGQALDQFEQRIDPRLEPRPTSWPCASPSR